MSLLSLPDWADLPNTPVTYPATYLAIAGERGLDTRALLQTAGLDPALVEDLGGRISLRRFLILLDALLDATGDTGLAIEASLRMPLTAHGSMGYALLCADRPRTAIDILNRFWSLRGRGICFRHEEHDTHHVFVFETELVLPERLRQLMLEATTLSFCQGVQFLLGPEPLQGEVCFDFPAGAHVDRLRPRCPPLRHQQPRTCVVLHDTERFERRLLTANPEGLQQALSQCERELALLGELASARPLLARARAEMLLTATGYPSPAELARRLHLSLRTLRRQLLQQGSGYQHLLDEARHRDALQLLASPQPEIARIAGLLGYREPANFTRAFRQWTGQTPSAFRAQALADHTRR